METGANNIKIAFEYALPTNLKVDGRKVPIILLHGVTSSKESWKDVMVPIAEATGRMVYAFDARNHGDSEWSDDFNYDIMQQDLLHLMDSLHIKKAILIGHSMGGKVAMFFAQKWKERVDKLIVEDISPRPARLEAREDAKKYVQFLDVVLEKIPSNIKDLTEAKNFVHDILLQQIPEHRRSSRHGSVDGSALPLTQDENGAYQWKTNLHAILHSYITSSTNSFFYTQNVFMGPTLIIYGTKSFYAVEEDKDFIIEIFPNAKFIAVEDATHQIHLEYEDIFLKEVINFITNVSTTQTYEQ